MFNLEILSEDSYIFFRFIKICSIGFDSGEYVTLYINSTLLIVFIYSVDNL